MKKTKKKELGSKPKGTSKGGETISSSARGRALLRPRDLPPGLPTPRAVVRRQNIASGMALRVSTWFTGNSRDSRQTWVPPTSNQRNSNDDEEGGLFTEKVDDTKVINVDDMDIKLGPKTTLGKTLQRLKKKNKSNPGTGQPIRQQDALEKVPPARSKSDIKASFADESETSRAKNGRSTSEFEFYEPEAPCWAYFVILFVVFIIFGIGFGSGYATSQANVETEIITEFVVQPTFLPTVGPTIEPTVSPTLSPTPKPTNTPTRSPTSSPVPSPTTAPSELTFSPTESPSTTPNPTLSPITPNTV